MQGANLEQRAVDPGFPLDGHANVLHAPPDFIDLLPVAAYACDASGCILWFNRRAAELWGRKPRTGDDGERFCGSWKLYFGGRQVSHAEAPMVVVLRTGEAIHGEEGCLEHPDGSRIWATVHIDPVKDAAGKVLGAINCFHDTTELHQARMDAAGRDARMHQLLEAIPAAIYTTDAAGRVTHYNRAAVSLAGREPVFSGDACCVNCVLFRPDGTPMPHDECPVALALEHKRADSGTEAFADRADGTRVPVISYSTPLFDAAGALTGAVNVLVDISKRKQAERALIENQQRLADELAATRQLQRVSAELLGEEDAHSIYAKLVDAATAVMGSDFASIQVLHPDRGERGELHLLESRGFTPEAERFWEWVRPGATTTCGAALRTGKRMVVPDVTRWEFMAGTEDLDVCLQTGVRALQTTPLVSRSGRVLGMISTHWREPHEPSEADLQRLDVLARQAADLLERAETEAALREDEARHAFVLQFSDALRGETRADTRANRATRMLAAHLDVDRCYIAHLTPEEDRVRIVHEFHKPGLEDVAGGYRLSDFPRAMQKAQAGPLVLRDVKDDPELSDRDKTSLANMTIAAMMAVILRRGASDLNWGLVVASRSRRDWSNAEIRLLDELAERTWSAVEGARMDEALHENQRRLEEASRTKDRFLAMLGHELRNPLAPIVTTLELMKLRGPDTFKHEREIIASQTHALVDMVDDLLDVARIARGDLKLDRHPLRIAEVTAEAADMAAWALTEHRQTLHTHIEPGVAVLGDRRRLVQVVVNLLVNAAKYSPPDRTIDMDVTVADDAAVIRVRDQGMGMAPGLQSRVFEAFTQAEQSLDRRRGGLGLGLAIVRNIVELHGGSVAAASEGKGKGSEFTVRLPLLHDDRTSGAADAAVAGVAARTERVATRVLLVDDHVAGAKAMGALLEALGYVVHIEHNAPAAIAAAKTHAPAIALLDIGLPDMDGYELARTLRAMPELKDLPLIALTGYGQAEDRERTRAAGFAAHVTKPVHPNDLVALIEELVHA